MFSHLQKGQVGVVSNLQWYLFSLLLILFAQHNLHSQTLPDIPDSTYVKDEIIIWFQDGLLNPYYLGCEQDTLPPSARINKVTSLPLDTTFIRSPEIVEFLSNIGVASIEKMIPSINPCHDIKSISRTGDTLWMPYFWNALVVKFNQEQDIPSIAYTMAFFFYDKLVHVQPNFIYTPLSDNHPIQSKPSKINFIPNDSLWILGLQTNLYSDHVGRAYVDSAWNYTKGNPLIVVGILDGGLDYRHPDLGGVYGSGNRVRGGWNYKSNISNFFDAGNGFTMKQVYHGTACAGIIGALTNNQIGVAGIAGGDNNSQSGVGLVGLQAEKSSEIAAAIWEAVATPLDTVPGQIIRSGNLWNCDIISCSIHTNYGKDPYGGLQSTDEIVRSIMAFSYQNGITSFIAMGNDKIEHIYENTDTTAGGYPMDVDKHWVTTVGSTEPDEINNIRDFGFNLDILAPTYNWSTVVDSVRPAGLRYYYYEFPGTSGAAPLASGVGGLLLSFHKNLVYPTKVRVDSLPEVLVPEDVDWLLKHTAQPLDSLNHVFDPKIGWGVVNAYQALSTLQYPYHLYHFEAPFTGEPDSVQMRDTLLIKFPGYSTSISYNPYQGTDNVYAVKKYRLVQTVSYPKVFNHVERAWGYGSSKTGYNYPIKIRKMKYRLPLYRVGYCSLTTDDSFDDTRCTLETYVYEVWKLNLSNRTESYIGWWPNFPNKIKFTYSVLAKEQRATFVEDEKQKYFIINGPYPNPFTVGTTIDYAHERGNLMSIDLLDILGRKVRSYYNYQQNGDNRFTLKIDGDGLVTGFYFLKFTFSDSNPIIKKIMKVR